MKRNPNARIVSSPVGTAKAITKELRSKKPTEPSQATSEGLQCTTQAYLSMLSIRALLARRLKVFYRLSRQNHRRSTWTS